MVGEGVRAFRAHGADAVIGFGGGAALDVSKLVAMMATNVGDDVLEYAWDHPRVRPILNELPPFVSGLNPSAENVALHVGRTLAARLPGYVQLVCVEVWETDENSARYRP